VWTSQALHLARQLYCSMRQGSICFPLRGEAGTSTLCYPASIYSGSQKD
jgi:hypothetical protein